MRKGKSDSIGILIGAMAEAESKIYYDDMAGELNALENLVRAAVHRDSTPERERILKDYEAGVSLTGPEHIFPTIFPVLLRNSTGIWMISGSRAS